MKAVQVYEGDGINRQKLHPKTYYVIKWVDDGTDKNYLLRVEDNHHQRGWIDDHRQALRFATFADAQRRAQEIWPGKTGTDPDTGEPHWSIEACQ